MCINKSIKKINIYISQWCVFFFRGEEPCFHVPEVFPWGGEQGAVAASVASLTA